MNLPFFKVHTASKSNKASLTTRCSKTTFLTVQKTSNEQIDGWVVELMVEGTINNAWNVERTADSGVVQFTPLTWNITIYPEGSVDFGFCGQL